MSCAVQASASVKQGVKEYAERGELPESRKEEIDMQHLGRMRQAQVLKFLLIHHCFISKSWSQ